MKAQDHWILPEGIEAVLPPHAGHLDYLCRRIIDLFSSWGYQLVIPPIVEYLESLLIGTGKDLELQIFKLTDQLNGRLMGLRADTTPQVARIDAYHLQQDIPARLCYLGSVLHTRAEYTGGSRSLLQVGGELYGHKGIESDLEILCLMIAIIKQIGIKNIHVDFGHVGIYKHLVSMAKLQDSVEEQLFSILQRKSIPELDAMIGQHVLSAEAGEMFRKLILANGTADAMQQIVSLFEGSSVEIKQCMDELQSMITLAGSKLPDVKFSCDLSELHGYRYHTGITFTAYVPGNGQGVAFGGRYDGIDNVFGRCARSATGFSADIKLLLSLSDIDMNIRVAGIYVPASDLAGQMQAINDLREQGEIVICELSQIHKAEDMGCDRQLIFRDNQWRVVSL